MKQRMAKVLSCALAIGLWTALISLQAEEPDRYEGTSWGLIQCGSVIDGYISRQRELNRSPTYLGIEDAIRYYYYDKVERWESEGSIFAKPYVTAEVIHEPDSDYMIANVVFSMHERRGSGVQNFDVGKLATIFKQGYQPVLLRAGVRGSYTLASRLSLDDGEYPETPTKSFYALDYYNQTTEFSGNAADRFGEIYETDTSDFTDFPAGFVKQYVVLSGLEFEAHLEKINYKRETDWSLSGGSGYTPPGVQDGRIYINAEDMTSNNFEIARIRDETNIHAEFSFPRVKDGGILMIDSSTNNLSDAVTGNMYMQGEMGFWALELGDQYILKLATLTFDSWPGTAILEADMARTMPKNADTWKNTGRLDTYQKLWNSDELWNIYDLSGTYDFSTEVFDGHIDGVPMKFHAPLSTPEGASAQLFAVRNDSRVRVREASDLESEILGHLENGDAVEILDRTTGTVKLGSMTDYWYLVRRVSDDLIGWSYGHFLDLDE